LREAQLYSVERYKNEENQFVGSVFHVYETPTSTDFHTYGEPHLRVATRMETHTHIKEEESSKEKEIRKTRELYKRWLAFWENYPKKVGKEKAGIAFKALPMYKQKEAIADNAADRYKNRKKKFIPNPATYLNGELWNDEQDEVEITSHHQVKSLVNQQAKVKELDAGELRRLANV